MIRLYVSDYRGNAAHVVDDLRSLGATLILLERIDFEAEYFNFEIYTDDESYLQVLDYVLFWSKSIIVREMKDDWSDEDDLYYTWCNKMRSKYGIKND